MPVPGLGLWHAGTLAVAVLVAAGRAALVGGSGEWVTQGSRGGRRVGQVCDCRWQWQARGRSEGRRRHICIVCQSPARLAN